MPYDRFLIAPINSGLQLDVKPWLVPDDAFTQLENAYIFRGRVRKRFGSLYSGTANNPQASRLRMQLIAGSGIGSTDGFGAAHGFVPGWVFQVGQMFSIYDAVAGVDVLYTVTALGVPTNMLITDDTISATFNTTTGEYVFIGAPVSAQIYFYPLEPVMGLTQYDTLGSTSKTAYGFDTEFAYVSSGTSWNRSAALAIALAGGAGVGTTDAGGGATGTVPGGVYKVGQMFSIGTEHFKVNALGTPVVMLTTGASATHTFNTTTGVYVFAGAAINTQIYFYPETPTFHSSDSEFFWATNFLGITPALTFIKLLFVTNYNATVPTPAADDDSMWYYDGTNWIQFEPRFAPAGGAATAGPFVKTCRIILQFKNRLILLNTIEQNGAHTVNTTHGNRCRYSRLGSPLSNNAWYEPGQKDVAGGIDGSASGGGNIDAGTDESIVSAEFVHDRLIVNFEHSTWELAFQNNEVEPFKWQQLSAELGSRSPWSAVPFDKLILNIGKTGVHGCNGVNVERIDEKIPDEIFKMQLGNTNDNRIHGIRDFYTEMVYWTFPPITNEIGQQIPNSPYPQKVLVYNYRNHSWAYNDDCITCFGYFEQQASMTWANSVYPWVGANFPWNGGVTQGQFRQVIAGNQQGFVFIVMPDIGGNIPSMSITNITAAAGIVTLTIVDHSLDTGDYIFLLLIQDSTIVTLAGGAGVGITNGAGAATGTVPGGIYAVGQRFSIGAEYFRVDALGNPVVMSHTGGTSTTHTFDTTTGVYTFAGATPNTQIYFYPGFTSLNQQIYPVTVIDANRVSIVSPVTSITYSGGGVAGRVSDIRIATKQLNPYIEKGRNVYVAKVEFCVGKTTAGQITVDYNPSSAIGLSMIDDAITTNTLLGSDVLSTAPEPTIPLEAQQERLWHPLYFQSDGSCIQLFFYLSDAQLRDIDVALADFTLEGMLFHTQPTTQRL